MTYTLQILHASDLEGGVTAIADAPNFAAVVEALDAQVSNTIILSAGDNYLPGPFFSAASDSALRSPLQAFYQGYYGEPGLTNIREGGGRIDISIMNAIGFDASAVGNHEFDLGTDTFAGLIAPEVRGGALTDLRWPGAQFPYLSANLDFTADSSLGGLYTSSILPNTDFAQTPAQLTGGSGVPKLAPATIITEGGEQIGVVGATTQLLDTITSNGGVQVIGGNANNMVQLASVLQPVINQLISQGINKIVVVSHLQDINLEKQLVGLLSGVDVIVAGGSDTLQADANDVLRPGDVAAEGYPFVTTNADGAPAVIVSTDGQYSYVGNLVLTFDENGVVDPSSIDATVSGAYATTAAVVNTLWGAADPFGTGTKGAAVQGLTSAVTAIVTAKDGAIFGETEVFLEGRRTAVRTEETNFGNLSADANLAEAKKYDNTVLISIKNGGGIRAQIGEITNEGGITRELPPQANPDAGKQAGEVSQLDIENSLRFNNGLTLLTVTAAQLLEIAEHAVAASAPGSTPGQFAQVSGLRFSYDLDLSPGDRIRSLAVVDESGRVIDVVARNGELIGDSDRSFRIVTLNFLADGGDGYPFPTDAAANRVDLVGQAEPTPGVASFAPAGSEQDALAEYLAANFATTPYAERDRDAAFDTRIQNVDLREDTVFTPSLTVLGSFRTGVFDAGAAEIVAYDPGAQQMFISNAVSTTVDIVDITNPYAPRLVRSLDLTSFGGGINSVAFTEANGGVLGVAVEAETKTDPGTVVFFDRNGNVLSSVTVGALPDMITFTPDGLTALTANEGEPNDDYTIDPEGSISLITVADGTVRTADFSAFIGQEAALRASGVRIFGPGANAAQDLEPEYIAVSPDGRTAFVTLQENNAVAVVDIASATVTTIVPLGLKDYSQGAGLDASDRDGLGGAPSINIRNQPVFGMYQPDAIASYQVGGITYYVTANEGDARDYDGFSEEERIKDLILDPTVFPNAATLQQDGNLGRLESTTAGGDLDGDGDQDILLTYGGRSFSIWDSTGNLVFDSGDDFERITAQRFPTEFNSTNDENGSFDSRSDAKGPEPEAVTVGVVNNRTYAFIGLERIGGVMIYDITNPTAAEFVDYVNNRDFSGTATAGNAGDLAPEDIKFISGIDSPTDRPMLLVANEVSGSTTLYDFDPYAQLGNPQDFNADLTTDILWRNQATGEVGFWFLDEFGDRLSFDFSINETDLNWTVAGLGDFNGDRQADILWRNQATGDNVVWFMDGTTRSSGVFIQAEANLQWDIQGVGDFNQDGQEDLFWRNQTTGENAVWLMDGTTRTAGFFFQSEADLNWQVGGIGDFDGDGYVDDLVWRNQATGVNALWYTEAGQRVGGDFLDAVPDLNWTIQGVTDFDRDGFQDDILWRNAATGDNVSWLLQGATRQSTTFLTAVSGSSGWTSVV